MCRLKRIIVSTPRVRSLNKVPPKNTEKNARLDRFNPQLILEKLIRLSRPAPPRIQDVKVGAWGMNRREMTTNKQVMEVIRLRPRI